MANIPTGAVTPARGVRTTNNNGPNARTAVTINPPAYTPATDNPAAGRDPRTLAVERQWRDVKRLGLNASHPATINKNSSYNAG